MDLRLITTESDFLALEPSWRELVRTEGLSDVFLSWEWASTWWKHFSPGKQLRILVGSHGPSVVGIAPLMLVREFGHTKLQFLGSGLADYSGILVRKGEHAFVAQCMTALASDLEWTTVDFTGFREGYPYLPTSQMANGALSRLSASRAYTVAPYLTMDSTWEQYQSTLRKKFKADTLRQYRRLQQLGCLKFRRAESIEEAQEMLQVFSVQKEARYISTGARNRFQDEALLPFFQDITVSLWPSNSVDVVALRLGDTYVAVSLSFTSGDTYYYYMPSFNMAYQAYSPGRLLLHSLLADCFRRGFSEFDFLTGEDPYKFEWTSRYRTVFRFTAYRFTPRGLILYALFDQVKPRLQQSHMVRGVVRRIRQIKGRSQRSTPS